MLKIDLTGPSIMMSLVSVLLLLGPYAYRCSPFDMHPIPRIYIVLSGMYWAHQKSRQSKKPSSSRTLGPQNS